MMSDQERKQEDEEHLPNQSPTFAGTIPVSPSETAFYSHFKSPVTSRLC